MPRSTQVQRLRAQLAASQEEVRSLKQQVADLCTKNAVTAQKLVEAAEQRMCKRLAAANAHCRDAEQRAEAAELRLLQHAEADRRAGLIKEEEEELKKLISSAPVVVEAVRRTGLMAAEDAAWAELIAARAASRDAVRRRRKMLRKRKQQWKRKHRGDTNPAHQENSLGSGSDNSVTSHCVATTDSPDSTVSTARIPANKALFIDNVCFWVAAFVPWSWAPVHSEAASTVLKVMCIYKEGWKTIRRGLAFFQSMGQHYAFDREQIGPGVGLIYSSYLEVQTLRHEVFRLVRADPRSITGAFASRWLLHMDKLLNMYEALRLSQKELYVAATNLRWVHGSARKKIQEALEVYKRRKQTDNKDDGAAVPQADSAA
eukprot:TRINITY_DN8984_c0_g1_i3.p1 TRINITY_DN8984_c0_g1~~TRINITY_DN8984_c0_g1_i3.p1  ORF type:complete len:373 (+),score=97.73 TRINITY_DN8984_c0_g1_i3:80-1198(+)